MAAKHRRSRSTGARLAAGTLAAVTVTAVAAGTLVLVNHYAVVSSGDTAAAAATGTPSGSATTAHSATGSAAQSQQRQSSATPTAVPLHVLNVAPDDTAPVNGATPVIVTFDEAVATTVLPQITPAVPGDWSRPTPTTLRFDPAVAFVPSTKVTVVVPAGMQATNDGLLATATTTSYRVADGSLLRLQQLLAELGYLPLDFTASVTETKTAQAQGELAFDPPQGQFSWRFASTPQPLVNLWQPGEMTAMTSGAVMAFENVHQLTVDGDAGPAVWTALLSDAVNDSPDPRAYTWAWTTMTHPETLKIWSNGEFVFTSPANTGIPAAPTPEGSWPVFLRYRSQTMQGTNPDGTKYKDAGVPYISYFHGGDAIHGFRRASYGSEQSLGCVELPYDAAARVWDLIDYGTVVTVTS
ncbi:MAG: L,D-transpeptidase family protein [Acidothermaceae bacterium]